MGVGTKQVSNSHVCVPDNLYILQNILSHTWFCVPRENLRGDQVSWHRQSDQIHLWSKFCNRVECSHRIYTANQIAGGVTLV